MQLTIGLSPRLELRQEQSVECLIELRQTLEDPFETARRIYERSRKVGVPIRIGDFDVSVRAAIVAERDLEGLFEEERFAGIMARLDEQYLFFNRHLQAPITIVQSLPQLMAFHCLAAIRVADFGDRTGTLAQYQAILLELAYAKTMLMDPGYAEYEVWRQTVERSGFFSQKDWRDMAQKTHVRFRELAGDMHLNARDAGFRVSQKGETLRLKGNVAQDRGGNEIAVHRRRLVR